MEAGERQPRPAADTSLRRSDTPTGSLLRDRLLLRLLACFLKLAETGDGVGSATTAMAFLGPTAVLLTVVSASLALGLRAEAEEAMWAVGCGGGALRRPGEVWYYVRRPSAIARRGGSGGGRRAGEVRATAAGLLYNEAGGSGCPEMRVPPRAAAVAFRWCLLREASAPSFPACVLLYIM